MKHVHWNFWQYRSKSIWLKFSICQISSRIWKFSIPTCWRKISNCQTSSRIKTAYMNTCIETFGKTDPRLFGGHSDPPTLTSHQGCIYQHMHRGFWKLLVPKEHVRHKLRSANSHLASRRINIKTCLKLAENIKPKQKAQLAIINTNL